jgi:murein DD-endopeptidase MepM/ murein hydrolase activator NlpD
MREVKFARRRVGEAAAACVALGLVAACSAGMPAPVIVGEATIAPGGPPLLAPPPPPGPILSVPRQGELRQVEKRPPPPPPEPRLVEKREPAPASPREGLHIVVRPGQSIGRLAERYHVSRRDIIAANRLRPPYSIETGQHLVIPGTAQRPPERNAAAGAPPAWVRHAGERPPPEIIPLDGPPPPARAGGHEAAASRREPGVSPAAQATAAPQHGGFLWPVEGRVVEGYGDTAGGHRNAGINIAAARGAPVRAVDGGVVAYAGNQLRGYGNLVLIKHADGFISAYAHCQELLVHRGEQVARGQVIAKVGKTGGVGEPQLHFELRKGDHAVDPRQFLAPAPSAGGRLRPIG